MCDSLLSLAQERWRPLLQLHGSSHPVLRETRSAHPSRIQYPSRLEHQERQLTEKKEASVEFACFFNALSSEIFNAEVLFREDSTPDEFIDVIVGNRVYMPCLYVSQYPPSRLGQSLIPLNRLML